MALPLNTPRIWAALTFSLATHLIQGTVISGMGHFNSLTVLQASAPSLLQSTVSTVGAFKTWSQIRPLLSLKLPKSLLCHLEKRPRSYKVWQGPTRPGPELPSSYASLSSFPMTLPSTPNGLDTQPSCCSSHTSCDPHKVFEFAISLPGAFDPHIPTGSMSLLL